MVDVRLALPADALQLGNLIERSTRGLSVGYYSPAQIEGAVRSMFAVDPYLIADGTYFVAHEGDEIVGSGGWSRRRSLYHGDVPPPGLPEILDPAFEAARIRAFFVAPSHARRGIGRKLYEACEAAARAAGFRRLELMATLPGVPLYEALGFEQVRGVTDLLPDGTPIDFIRMTRTIA